MNDAGNLLGIPPTRLPDTPEATVATALLAGESAVDLAAQYPATSLPWATLAEEAAGRGAWIEAYAYARTGYHRGLDALRRNGWRGQGPVPWDHAPNRGFLRALRVLGRAAEAIGENAERDRCATFLRDCDPQAAVQLA
ncbi:MAG: DUF3151 domain-containing protein [Actinomycetota bacterium]